ncbi:hypothetical protein BC940DRAFT_350974 [Gongronella butleri]|nr:hypothetical protein BC940DRAFT_350974 [Gongronella butleri]
MDSYLSSIDDYIQEQDMQQPPSQQQQQQQGAFFQQQASQQQQQQQPQQAPFDVWGSFGPDGFPHQSPPSQAAASMYIPMDFSQPPAAPGMSYPMAPNAFMAPPPHGQLPPGQGFPPLPGFDIHGNPIKIRKKPGRKPNPASPALRKAQNRAAQRAFRERKERHLKDLENTIKTLREQRNSTAKELKKSRNRLEMYRVELWYLRGLLITLQFMCMHHNIDLPPHMPYLAEETLIDMAKTHPHAIEAYVNAYTRNNRHLKKPNLSAQLAAMDDRDSNASPTPPRGAAAPTSMSSSSAAAAGIQENGTQGGAMAAKTPNADGQAMDHDGNNNGHVHHQQQYHPSIVDDMTSGNHSSLPPLIPPPDDDNQHHAMTIKQEEDHDDVTMADDREASVASSGQQQQRSVTPFSHEDVAKWTIDDAEDDDDDDSQKQANSISSMGAIQRIRLQLRVQSTLSRISSDKMPSARLQPTLLQLSIPHDPRIDLIPAPQMRDRMIIFRDQMDYDSCFSLLLNGAIYHGGDPTLSQSWELPPSFHSEYWFLTSRYDIDTTNRWRRIKGLTEIPPGAPDRHWTPPPPSRGAVDTPSTATLMDPTGMFSPEHHSQGSATGAPSPHAQNDPTLVKHPLYDKVLGVGSPPESRPPITSPTLDIMMTMMQSLSSGEHDQHSHP